MFIKLPSSCIYDLFKTCSIYLCHYNPAFNGMVRQKKRRDEMIIFSRNMMLTTILFFLTLWSTYREVNINVFLKYGSVSSFMLHRYTSAVEFILFLFIYLLRYQTPAKWFSKVKGKYCNIKTSIKWLTLLQHLSWGSRYYMNMHNISLTLIFRFIHLVDAVLCMYHMCMLLWIEYSLLFSYASNV